MAAGNKRALLIHNNPYYLENHLGPYPLPMNMLLNITPARLSGMDQNHWNIYSKPR